jgi:hypothetical protein
MSSNSASRPHQPENNGWDQLNSQTQQEWLSLAKRYTPAQLIAEFESMFSVAPHLYVDDLPRFITIREVIRWFDDRSVFFFAEFPWTAEQKQMVEQVIGSQAEAIQYLETLLMQLPPEVKSTYPYGEILDRWPSIAGMADSCAHQHAKLITERATVITDLANRLDTILHPDTFSHYELVADEVVQRSQQLVEWHQALVQAGYQFAPDIQTALVSHANSITARLRQLNLFARDHEQLLPLVEPLQLLDNLAQSAARLYMSKTARTR